jgi:hypothetical protein
MVREMTLRVQAMILISTRTRVRMIRRSTVEATLAMTVPVVGMTEVLRRRVVFCLVDFREFDVRR